MVASVVTVASNTGTANFNVSVPSGAANGDLLIAINTSDWSTLATKGVPVGFTSLTISRYDGGSNKVHMDLGYRIASSEPASYTFSSGSGSDSVGAILRITGHDSTPTIAQVAPVAVTAGSGAINAPSVTPNGSDDLLLCFGCVDGANGGGALTWTVTGAGLTEHVDAQSSGAWTSLVVGSLGSPSSPSGTKTLVTSPTNHNAGCACTISIKSASTGQQVTLNRATEVNTGRALTIGKQAVLSKATETDLGRPLALAHTKLLARATEVDTSRGLIIVKNATLQRAVETDVARTLTPTRPILVTLGRAVEGDTARALLIVRTVPLNRTVEVDTSRQLTKHTLWSLFRSVSTESAKSLKVAKNVVLGRAVETDVAQTLSSVQFQNVVLGRALETDTARSLVVVKRVGLARAIESDVFRLLGIAHRVALGRTTETDAAGLLTFARGVQLSKAFESSTARNLLVVKSLVLSRAIELDLAQELFMPILNWPPVVEGGRGQLVPFIHATAGIDVSRSEVQVPEGSFVLIVDTDLGESPT